jgi:hypothetical protein
MVSIVSLAQNMTDHMTGFFKKIKNKSELEIYLDKEGFSLRKLQFSWHIHNQKLFPTRRPEQSNF